MAEPIVIDTTLSPLGRELGETSHTQAALNLVPRARLGLGNTLGGVC